jgi:hypothetical protein
LNNETSHPCTFVALEPITATIGSTSSIVIGKVSDRSEKFCGAAHLRIASKKTRVAGES